MLRRNFSFSRAGASLAEIDGFAVWAEGMRLQNLTVLAAAGVVLAIQCGLIPVVVAGDRRYFSRPAA
jgi:hypothetical protein